MNGAKRFGPTQWLVAVAVIGASGCGAFGFGSDPVGSNRSAVTCATGATLKGVDVSSYQGSINWNTVRAGGIAFGFAD